MGIAATPDGGGYWLAAADGGVFSYGDAAFFGSLGGHHLNSPIVGIATTPDGAGYWLDAADGGVFGFGDAHFFGSMGGMHLNKPVVGMASTVDGQGYWLVATDGGIFSFGDAQFYGSTGGIRLNQPVVGMAAHVIPATVTPAPAPEATGTATVTPATSMDTPATTTTGTATATGTAAPTPIATHPAARTAPTPAAQAATSTPATSNGYWLVASDGGIFSYGDAPFFGSTGSIRLNQPVVGMAGSLDGGGYWMVARDGGIFNYADAVFYGSGGGSGNVNPAVGLAVRPGGYWIAYGRQQNTPFGPAMQAYAASRGDNVTAAAYDLRTGQLFLYRPGIQEFTASIVKADILATLLSQAQAQGRGLTSQERSLATVMIENSDNNAASALYSEVGSAPGVSAFNSHIPMPATAPAGPWGLTRTTPADQIALLQHLVLPNGLLTDASRNYELNLMENVTPSQRWGVSGGVPAGVTIANKNGWSPESNNGGLWQINSIGWISGQGHNYLLAVMTNGNPSMGYGIDTINQVASFVWQAMG